MLTDAKTDLENGEYTTSNIDSLMREIIEASEEDGRYCDNDEVKQFGREANTAWSNVNIAASNYRNIAIQQIDNLKRKYENLDESEICGEVDASSPLTAFALSTGIIFSNYLYLCPSIHRRNYKISKPSQ